MTSVTCVRKRGRTLVASRSGTNRDLVRDREGEVVGPRLKEDEAETSECSTTGRNKRKRPEVDEVRPS